MAISQKPILPKCHSPKSLLLLHFSMNLSETFRINVNMDFAHTNCGQFLSPKSKISPLFKKKYFGLKIFWRPKSKIDQDKFIELCRRSRLFGE